MSLSYTVNQDALKRNIKKMNATKGDINNLLFLATFDSILGVMNTAKEPGYAPYKTGTLRRSITIDTDKTAEKIVGYVGSNLDYARIHEYGGYTGRGHSVYIEPKKYLSRAVEDNKPEIKRRFKRLLSIKNRI